MSHGPPTFGTNHADSGSVYIRAFGDEDGERLDGRKSYRLRKPPNVPAAAFSLLMLCETAMRSMIQDRSEDAARSSCDQLTANADRSIELYFGPPVPARQQSHWIEFVAGNGFYPKVRFYTSKEGFFDRTWLMPDVELAQ